MNRLSSRSPTIAATVKISIYANNASLQASCPSNLCQISKQSLSIIVILRAVTNQKWGVASRIFIPHTMYSTQEDCFEMGGSCRCKTLAKYISCSSRDQKYSSSSFCFFLPQHYSFSSHVSRESKFEKNSWCGVWTKEALCSWTQ